MSRFLSSFTIFPRSAGMQYGVTVDVPSPSRQDRVIRRYKRTAFRLIALALAISAGTLAATA